MSRIYRRDDEVGFSSASFSGYTVPVAEALIELSGGDFHELSRTSSQIDLQFKQTGLGLRFTYSSSSYGGTTYFQAGGWKTAPTQPRT